MKRIFSTLVIGLLLFPLCVGQSITGTIRSVQNLPIDFANVVILTKQDSAFVTGCISDRDGRFSLSLELNLLDNILLNISCMGYESKTLEVSAMNLGDITLYESIEELQEVLISVHRSQYIMKEGVLIANVNNSPLKDVGNAIDVLKNMPLLNVGEESICVFGKGTPLIYINNREVRNKEELEQLISSQITKVEIITSPSAKYPAAVNAVIRITVMKRSDKGLAGSAYFRAVQREKWNENANINLNYNTTKLNVFGALSLSDTKFRKEQTTETSIIDTDSHQIIDDTKMYLDRLASRTSLGLDYTINNKQSIGVKYDLSFTGRSKNTVLSDLAYMRNREQIVELKNNSDYKNTGNNGYLNTYYNGKFGTFDVNLNADYVHGNSTADASYITQYGGDNTTDKLDSKSKNKYNLAAMKLEVNKKIGKTNLEFGGEYNHTNNWSEYTNFSEEKQSDLPNRETKNKQDLFALFAVCRHSWKNFNIYVGLRYEHTNFQYYLNKIKSGEQSETYNQLFPVVNMSYSLLENKINMSFSYKRTVNRPNYYQLRGDIQYNSPFSYEGGNPALKNTVADNFGYTFSFADFYLNTSLNIFKNQSMFILEQFGDKPISLATFVNVDDYKQFSVSAVWSPTFFKIWNPTLESGIQKQYLKLVNNYEAVKYNKPNVYFSLNNTFKLPKKFVFVVNAKYWSAYHSEFSHEKETMLVDTRIQKHLLNNNLTLVVGMENIFDTYDEKWKMNYKNILFDKSAKNDNRFIYASVRFSFNNMKIYRGKGAANEERSRL